ncbi:hypothetical protein GC167_09615 [bacterium]|nr:hypothetical protein [bacterium]
MNRSIFCTGWTIGLIWMGSEAKAQDTLTYPELQSIFFEDSLFVPLESEPEPIPSELFFTMVEREHTFLEAAPEYSADSLSGLYSIPIGKQYLSLFHHNDHPIRLMVYGQWPDLDAYALTHCQSETCQDWLISRNKPLKVLLPSYFDWGPIGASLSPDKKTFVVYDSYDNPYWNFVAPFRSVVYLFHFGSEKTLDSMVPWLRWSSDEWSIHALLFAGPNHLALQLYKGVPPDEKDVELFEYMLIELP